MNGNDTKIQLGVKTIYGKLNIHLERYLAIVAIIALGVGFFSGLKITQDGHGKNLDTYVLNQQMYDFKLISTLGLTNEDVEYFPTQDGITAEGAISMDFIADMDIEQ